MHTTKMKSGVTFHHNVEYFGDVIIVAPYADNKEIKTEVVINFSDLVSLVAAAVRHQKISQLKESDPLTLLGLKPE